MTQLATTTQRSGAIARFAEWSPEDMLTLRQTVARELDESQFKVFAQVIRKTGLCPFSKQIYAILRYDKKVNGKVMTIQTAIDGYRLIAQRSGEYAGQVGPQWCGPDGVWKDVWLSTANPMAARVGVLRAGCEEPFWGVALFREYNAGQGRWEAMPANQIAKCAEAQALRKAFPAETSGIYAEDEMDQADHRAEMPDMPRRKGFRDKVQATKPVVNQANVVEQAPPVPTADEPGPSGDESQDAPVVPATKVLDEKMKARCADLKDWRAACEDVAIEVGMSTGELAEFASKCAVKVGKESSMQFTVPERIKFLTSLINYTPPANAGS